MALFDMQMLISLDTTERGPVQFAYKSSFRNSTDTEFAITIMETSGVNSHVHCEPIQRVKFSRHNKT